jgi:hypothetical protein
MHRHETQTHASCTRRQKTGRKKGRHTGNVSVKAILKGKDHASAPKNASGKTRNSSISWKLRPIRYFLSCRTSQKSQAKGGNPDVLNLFPCRKCKFALHVIATIMELRVLGVTLLNLLSELRHPHPFHLQKGSAYQKKRKEVVDICVNCGQ